MRCRYFLSIICSVGFFAICFSQPSPVLKYYDVSSGLPTNHLYKMVQDKKGYIWLATDNGISRFDGHNFKNYSVKNGLPDNDILDVFLDHNDRVWFIPFSGTPFYYDVNEESLITYQKEKGLGVLNAEQFLSGHGVENGNVNFYDLNKIFTYKPGKVPNIKIVPLHNLRGLVYFTEWNNRQFIIYSNGAIFRIDGNQLSLQTVLPGPEIGRPGAIQKGSKLIFKNRDRSFTLIYFSKAQNKFSRAVSAYESPVSSIAFTHNRIAVASTNKFIYFLNNNTLVVEDSIYTGAENMYVLQTKDSSFWVATADKGLIKITYPQITDFKLPKDFAPNITALVKDFNSIYVANSFGDIYKIKNDNTSAIVRSKTGVNDFFIKEIIKFRERLYVGDANRLYKLSRGFTEEYLRDSKLVITGVKDLLVFKDSVLYVGTSSYLAVKHLGDLYFTNIEKTRSTCLTIDSIGRLYRGSKSGITIFNNDKPIPLSDYDKQSKVAFTKLTTTQDGLIWGGTSNDTIYVWKGNRVIKKITFAQDSYGSICKELVSVKPGIIWYATNLGLVKISYRYKENQLFYTTLFYGDNDGLSAAVINSLQIFNDTLFLATNKGLKIMPAGAVPHQEDLPVYLSSITVNSTPVSISQNLELEYSSSYVQLQYNCIDFSGVLPRLQFKINDAGWEALNGNTITLNNMSPDRYNIYVRAMQSDGRPSVFVSSFMIIVHGPYWQKAWFYALLCLFSIIIATLFVQYRNRQKLRTAATQQLLIEQQKEKITADLHDDIGASLSSVQINSSVALRLFSSDPEKSKALLQKLEKQSQNLGERMSDFIWSMKPGKHEFLNLKSRITNYAAEILGAENISFTISVKDNTDMMLSDFDLRKTILLVTKEAINNAAKYSKASKVEVEIYTVNNQLTLEVCDNGKGLDKDFTPGNGLRNMQQRAEGRGGRFELLPLRPHGTKIKLSMPIP